MPTTQDGKKTGAAARAEAAEDNSFTSNDTFENPSLKALANTATVEDGFGIERIVGTSTSAFTPAPLEATPEQIKAMEDFQGKLDEAKTQRTALLQGNGGKVEDLSDVPNEERAPNSPAIGGTSVVGSPAKDAEQAEGTGDKKESSK